MTSPSTIISSAALTSSGRWDAAYHICAQGNATEAAALEQVMDAPTAQALAQSMALLFEPSQVRSVLGPLCTGRTDIRAADAADVKRACARHPFLALALLHKALPQAADEQNAIMARAIKKQEQIAQAAHQVISALASLPSVAPRPPTPK